MGDKPIGLRKLTPIIVIAANDNTPCDEQADIAAAQARVVIAQDKVALYENLLAAADPADTARIALLTQRRDVWAANLALYQDRIVRYQGYITGWQANIADYQSRIAVHNTRIDTITANIAANDIRITDQQDKIADVEARQAVIAARLADNIIRIAAWQAQLDTLQTQCGASGGTGENGTPALSYLHTDHLGKPQFATDETGATIWDAGAKVTPFGDGINTAAAFAQNLQFPGQYHDAETALSHNHHRTYDPTLGRYLQSDPIGLAGGLNRYAYVGGNPMGFADPLGLSQTSTFTRGAAFAEARSMFGSAARKAWRGKNVYAGAFLLGYGIGLTGKSVYLEWQNANAINAANNANDCDDEESNISDILDELTSTPTPPPDRCKIVRQQCLIECESSLGGAPWSQGMAFHRCVNQCLSDNNCGGTNYR